MIQALPPGKKVPVASREKAKLIAQEWVEAGLDAAAIGEAEWALGRPTIESWSKDVGYPVTAANLVCEDGRRPFPAVRRIERQGRSVAVIGLTTGSVEGCVVTDPVQAVFDASVLLASNPADATVLLWPVRGEAAHTATLTGLPVDVVLDASGRYSKDLSRSRKGSSLLVGAGNLTKNVGQLSLTPGTGGFFAQGEPKAEAALLKRLRVLAARSGTASRRSVILDRIDSAVDALDNGTAGSASYRLFPLDDAVTDDEAVQARVDAVKKTLSQGATASPAVVLSRPLVVESGPYIGAAACASCHPEATAQWRKTGHARAYTALLRKQRHLDPSCYSCHVTGENPSQPGSEFGPDEVGGRIHVQCESCHGPGRAHVAETSVLPVRNPAESVCRSCHDGDRDDGQFDYETYLPKVVHRAAP